MRSRGHKLVRNTLITTTDNGAIKYWTSDHVPYIGWPLTRWSNNLVDGKPLDASSTKLAVVANLGRSSEHERRHKYDPGLWGTGRGM